ncbi:hypothetical protein LshimejAT787_1200350 [Lyophyllum shimeji]|uniref:G-protein coupled receptors family 2 profile 2 domain-containing protein n=1 Tax=Lyophyllum shimeji TaxID=47721 RepID=A0A9P3PWP5_LYOSH|nr:hypothetical protein LshimejAT787_1200350 [Lyophyllum shimeji]
MYSTRRTSGSHPLIPPDPALSPPASVLPPPASVLVPPDSPFLHRRIPDSRFIVAPRAPHITIQFLQGKGSLDLFSLDLPLPASCESASVQGSPLQKLNDLPRNLTSYLRLAPFGPPTAQSMSSDSYTITDAEIAVAGVLAYACTIPGTIVCGLVLIAYGLTALSPIARKSFDRVSFRLLVYSLVFNVLFGIAYAATPTSPSKGCDVGAFAVNFTLCFATFFTTCIAINLQLVLVHGYNGQNLEKYYLIGTTLLSLALNIPTVALHQFGWNELSATCWYSNPDDKARLRWIIGTQSFWISLAATIETICSSVVLAWMYHFQRDIKTLNRSAESTVEKSGGTKHTKSTTKSRRSSLLSHDPRYKTIILRIALYPIVSLMMNFSTVILDLNMSIVGVNTQADYRLLVADLILYGLRTLAYGLLAASDPSFVNALREVHVIKAGKTIVSDRTITAMEFASKKPATVQSQAGGATVMEADLELQQGSSSDATTSEVSSEGQIDSRLSTPEDEEKEMRNIARQL